MTDKSIEEEAESYVSEEKEVKNVKEAIAGASDILAESVADEASPAAVAESRFWSRVRN